MNIDVTKISLELSPEMRPQSEVRKLTKADVYNLAAASFGKQKVVIEVTDGQVNVISQPDNVSVVVYHNDEATSKADRVRRCRTCGRHKYEVKLKVQCGYDDCGWLCSGCIIRCPYCFNAYCKDDLTCHLSSKHGVAGEM